MKKRTDFKTNKRSEAVSLKQGIEALLDAYKLRKPFNESSVIANWEKYVGTPIAKQTSKIYINNKVLFVRIESPVMRNELKMMKSKILSSINDSYAEKMIEEVIFV